MRRTLLGAATAALIVAAPAPAWQPPTGWDGSNPFVCELQQAGFGTEVPDPGADPYCVEFDKRRQNITELGVVDFLSKEPARVAAAVDKCFYFQSDHWRGSVVQEDGTTKTYEWDGHYFFDKARAEGGVWVTNFNVNGQTFDPSQLPGIPPEFAQHMGPGTGGVRTRNEIPADPRCVAKLAGATPVDNTPQSPRCGAPAGGAGPRVLGPVALGDSESRVRSVLGPPARMHRGFLRYCVAGGGKYLVGLPGDRSGEAGEDPAAQVEFLLTTHTAYRVRGVGRGAPSSAVRRAFPRRRARVRYGRTVVLETARRSGVLVGLRGGRVRYLVVTSARVANDVRALRSWLRRAS